MDRTRVAQVELDEAGVQALLDGAPS